MRRFLKKLLRLLSAKKFTSGFVVEQFTQNSMSGWILLADKSYPETNNFYFFSAGEKIEISVSLVNRKGCCNLYLSNYYGFQITFAETLDDIESKSFFYNDQQVCIEPSYVSVAHQLAAKPAMPVYYSNKIAMYEILERRLGADVVRMSESQFQRKQKAQEHHQFQLITALATTELSGFNMHVGIRSKCGVAVTGKQGHLFLHGGSNKVDELFQKDNCTLEIFTGWQERIAARQLMASNKNFKYIQIVIPEKQSILPELYYRKITSPSALLLKFEQLKGENYVSVLEHMREKKDIELFFKTDSHLNSQGSFLLFKRILEFLDTSTDITPSFTKKNITIGDLGSKFRPYKLWEDEPVASGVKVQDRNNYHQYIPTNKGHMGRSIHWKNPKAPIKKKVLIFGNSFFDMGTQQHHLTYWFSLAFEECQFVWSTEFNEKQILTFKPDFVIGQTIERFLRQVPLN